MHVNIPAIKYRKQINVLEKELQKLKDWGFFKFSKKNISLKGVLKGAQFTESEIEKSKKSLFKE